MTAGGLRIEREGEVRRFVADVELITFNGEAAVKKGQEAIYVTERAVFRRERDGMALVEVAPGLDVQKDVLAHVEFPVRVSPPPARSASRLRGGSASPPKAAGRRR